MICGVKAICTLLHKGTLPDILFRGVEAETVVTTPQCRCHNGDAYPWCPFDSESIHLFRESYTVRGTDHTVNVVAFWPP